MTNLSVHHLDVVKEQTAIEEPTAGGPLMVDAFLRNSPCPTSHPGGRLSPHTTRLLPHMALLHLALWINSLKAKSTLSGGKVGVEGGGGQYWEE